MGSRPGPAHRHPPQAALVGLWPGDQRSVRQRGRTVLSRSLLTHVPTAQHEGRGRSSRRLHESPSHSERSTCRNKNSLALGSCSGEGGPGPPPRRRDRELTVASRGLPPSWATTALQPRTDQPGLQTSGPVANAGGGDAQLHSCSVYRMQYLVGKSLVKLPSLALSVQTSLGIEARMKPR